jgi:glyoxylase-like metal-dependent hydrolase (beta-lactamase superfamily II)
MVAGLGWILIDPVEGDMADYLASLGTLLTRPATRLLPAHGDAIYSELHNRAGTFLRPGPCGWPLCSIGGRITIVNPRFVSAGEEKPVEEEPVPVAPVAATPAPVAAVAAPPAKPKTSYIAKRKISSFS